MDGKGGNGMKVDIYVAVATVKERSSYWAKCKFCGKVTIAKRDARGNLTIDAEDHCVHFSNIRFEGDEITFKNVEVLESPKTEGTEYRKSSAVGQLSIDTF